MKSQTAFTTTDGANIEKTELLLPTRPLLASYDGTLLIWHEIPDEPQLLMAFRQLRCIGYSPVDHYGRQTILLKTEARSQFLRDFGLTKLIASDVTQIPRLGKLLAFTCESEPFTVIAKGVTWTSEERDGTVLVSKRFPHPMQGRAIVNNCVITKGIGRPPIGDEPEGFCCAGQFGKETVEGDAFEFYPISDLQPQRPGWNLQAIAFGLFDPLDTIEKDNKRLNESTVIDIVPSKHREKVTLGIPAGLLLDQMGPWSWLRKFPVKGARLPVLESDQVPIGRIVTDLETAERLDLCDGDYVHLLRDPAKPDGTAFQKYEYDLSFDVPYQAIFLNPQDPKWNAQGGDFDGDYAVLTKRRELIANDIPTTKPYKARRRPMAVINGKAQYESALLSRQASFESMVGSVILTAMRLFEVGQLSEEDKRQLSQLAQAAIDSKKHPIDSSAARRDYDRYFQLVKGMKPENGFVLDFINAINRAEGFEAKVEAWRELGKRLDTISTRFESLVAQRYDKIDRLFNDASFLRGHRLTLPQLLTDAARAHLTADDSAPEQARLIKDVSDAFRRAIRAIYDGDDDAKRIADLCRVQIECMYKDGEVSAAALLAYAPARLAAELVTVEDLKQFKVRTRSAILCLKAPMTNGVYSINELQACDTHKHDLTFLMYGFEYATVTIIETFDDYVRANIEPITTAASDDIDDDIEFA